MSQRAAVAAVLLLLGLALLALGLWLRAGASAAARSWMTTGPNEQWMLERVVVIGAPLFGVILVCAAVLAAPWELPVLRTGAIGLLILLSLPTVYFILPFLPIPGFLYPRWARIVRQQRRMRWGG